MCQEMQVYSAYNKINLFLNWEHLCFVLCYEHNGDESPWDSAMSLVNLIPFSQGCFHLVILFVFLLIISLYGWPYLRPSLRSTSFSLLIRPYLYRHVMMMMMIIIMMMMMMIIMMIIIIIIIIGLRNEKPHNRHPYISKTNIRTIKSSKIILGDKFYVRKKNKRLHLFDLTILEPRILRRFQDFWKICGPLE
jgi:hypothetical protein